MDKIYAAAENKVREAIGQFAAGTHTDPGAAPVRLYPESVIITGAPRKTGFSGKFARAIRIGADEDAQRERIDAVVDFGNPEAAKAEGKTDLRAANEGHVRKGVLAAMQNLFSTISLPGGGSLADKYNFSGETTEEAKPQKEQLADLKQLVNAGITEAQGVIPAEVVTLLQNAKTFEVEKDQCFFGCSKPDVAQGYAALTFNVSNKGEGELSNAALVQKNILARKEEVLAAIREKAIAIHTASGANPEDLQKFQADIQKLDLQVDITNGEYGESIRVSIGNKIATSAAGQANSNQPPVDKTVLAQFSEDKLVALINDSILFKGAGAADVAPLMASDNDVRRILEQYKDTAPSFTKALDNPVMKNAMSWPDREKLEKAEENDNKPIQPCVTMNTSFSDGKLNNEVHLNMELPKGVTHSDVVRALAGKAQQLTPEQLGIQNMTLGNATDALAKERAQQPAAGAGAVVGG